MTLSVKAKSTGARAQQTRLGRAPRGRSARPSLAPASPGTQLGTPAPPPLRPPQACPSPPPPSLLRAPHPLPACPAAHPSPSPPQACDRSGTAVAFRHLWPDRSADTSAGSSRPRPAPPTRPPRTQAAVRRQPGLPPDLLFTQNQPPRRRHSFKRRTPVRACALWLPTAEARGQDPGWDRGAGPGGGAGPRTSAGCGVRGVSKWTKMPGGSVSGSRCRPQGLPGDSTHLETSHHLGTCPTWGPYPPPDSPASWAAGAPGSARGLLTWGRSALPPRSGGSAAAGPALPPSSVSR